jgi:hypothetical protein
LPSRDGQQKTSPIRPACGRLLNRLTQHITTSLSDRHARPTANGATHPACRPQSVIYTARPALTQPPCSPPQVVSLDQSGLNGQRPRGLLAIAGLLAAGAAVIVAEWRAIRRRVLRQFLLQSHQLHTRIRPTVTDSQRAAVSFARPSSFVGPQLAGKASICPGELNEVPGELEYRPGLAVLLRMIKSVKR